MIRDLHRYFALGLIVLFFRARRLLRRKAARTADP